MPSGTLQLRKRREPRVTYYPLLLLAGSLSAGILLDRYWPLALLGWLIGSFVCLATWCGLWLTRRDAGASYCLLLSVLCAGGAWHHAYWRLYPATEVGRMAREIPGPCCVEAIALTSPRWIPEPAPSPLRTIPVPERCELLVFVTSIRDGQACRRACGRVELTVAGFIDHVRAGDRIRILGQMSRPAPPLNPGEFDFSQHERAQRVNGRLFVEFPQCIERVARESRWSPRRLLADARAGGINALERQIAHERARLAAAVLLGAREQLDPDLNEGYLVTGTVHVLSVSGLHVGILAAMFFGLLNTGLLSRRASLAATVLLTIAYAALTDMQPPVVRAAILVSATCLALWQGQLSAGLNTLAGALVVVLGLNPASLFQVGTQLSFIAVATMIAGTPLLVRRSIDDPLDRLIAVTRPWPQRTLRWLCDWTWRLWLTGAFIWLVSTPLVWQHYHLISPVALVLNCLIWPPVTLVMYSGLLTLVFGTALPVLGAICGSVCDGSLGALEWLIAVGRNMPFGHFWLAAPPTWWTGVFYALVGVMFFVPALRPRVTWMVAGGSLWCAVALYLSVSPGGPVAWNTGRPLECHFVAVGHGLGVLIELPDGRKMLYDSGRLGSPPASVRPIAGVLWNRGVRHLDAIVVSHADADHFNGIPGLLERFSLGTIYVSPTMFDADGRAVEALREAIAASGVPIKVLQSGQKLDAGAGTRITVLHPPRSGVYGSDNANSIVLLIEMAGRRVLLTGDLESPGLEDVLAEEPLDCDIVLAPHHGSPRSSPGRFADWCRPEHVIISGRRAIDDARTIESVRNSFRLRGAEVYHTAEDGCVSARIDASGISIFTHLPHVRAPRMGPASGNLLQSE